MKKNANAPDISVEQNAEGVKMKVVKSENSTTTEIPKPNFLTVIKGVREEHQMLSSWEKLDTTEKELDSFIFSSDAVRDSITIKDSEGHAFTTNNTFLIQQVTDLLKKLVSDKKDEIEAQLKLRRAA